MEFETFKQIFEEIDDEEMVEMPEGYGGYGVADKMFTFIEKNINIEELDEEQTDAFNDILVCLEDDVDEDLEEANIRKKISAVDKRERKREYRKNKAAVKRKAKKFRKTIKFKKYKKKAKRKAKQGKTASGKRKTTFI